MLRPALMLDIVQRFGDAWKNIMVIQFQKFYQRILQTKRAQSI